MPGKETGEIIKRFSVAGHNLVRSRFRDLPIIKNLIGYLVKMWFYELAFGSVDYQKYSGKHLSKQELADKIICLKSIGEDYLLNDFIAKQYQTTHFIGLIRNGYSFCNGMERRGHKTRKVAERYKQYVDFLLEQEKSCPNFILIRFEDIISAPFVIANQIYDFIQVNPVKLQKLRLKAKRILTQDGNHKTPSNRVEGEHYWFNEKKIKEFLDGKVNERQEEALSLKSREIFSEVCRESMKRIGY